MTKELVVYAMALILSAVCAFMDWKVHKIPNKWTFPGMWAGLLTNGIFWGGGGVINSILGILAGFAFFVFFAAGVLKAGDVKFYMALGGILGCQMNLKIMAASVLLGGIEGIALMVIRRNGKKRLWSLWLYMKRLFLFRKWERYEVMEKDGTFCFGICIALGTLAVIVCQAAAGTR